MTDDNPRAAIGLDAAHNGSVKGVRQFADFVRGELFGMGVTAGLPLDIKHRVLGLARDTECVVQFIDGYLSAKSEGIE